MNDEKNKLDAFERRMKDTLDQFEVPYNSADWTEMESALSGGTKGWWLGGAGLITRVLAGALAAQRSRQFFSWITPLCN